MEKKNRIKSHKGSSFDQSFHIYECCKAARQTASNTLRTFRAFSWTLRLFSMLSSRFIRHSATLEWKMCAELQRKNFNSIFRGRSQTPLFHFYFLKEKKSFFVPHSNGGELSRVEFVHRRPKLISTQHLDSIKNVSFHSALVVASVTVDAWLATTKQRAPSIILIRSLQFA